MQEIQNWFIENFGNKGVNQENVSDFMSVVKSMSEDLEYIFKRKITQDSEGYYNGIKPIDGGFSIKNRTDVVIKGKIV